MWYYTGSTYSPTLFLYHFINLCISSEKGKIKRGMQPISIERENQYLKCINLRKIRKQKEITKYITEKNAKKKQFRFLNRREKTVL